MPLPRIFRLAVGTWLLPALLAPQGPTDASVLPNVGKPILVPFRCTEEDMRWAGLSCSAEEPCPIFLELTAVEAIGDKLFTAGNIHSQTVTLYSVLLGSDDRGLAWREVHRRIRGAGLDHLQFANLENGWAGGEALSPLPQDPFVLITSDGGKTWHQQAIFSESRVGSIQQLWFSTKDEGALVVDRGPGTGSERYELYESGDSGNSWTIKEAKNQPIRIKETATAALWRLQADGKTQSFRVEHQEATRWNPVASFAVNVGACSPAPAESNAPPDPALEPPEDRQPQRPSPKAPPRRNDPK